MPYPLMLMNYKITTAEVLGLVSRIKVSQGIHIRGGISSNKKKIPLLIETVGPVSFLATATQE